MSITCSSPYVQEAVCCALLRLGWRAMTDRSDGQGSVTGAYLEDVRIGPEHININFDRRDDLPTNEHERRAWMTRQIQAINTALLGNDEYGVSGLIDAVRNQRIWLIVLTACVVLILVLLSFQSMQIRQILHEISMLTRIP